MSNQSIRNVDNIEIPPAPPRNEQEFYYCLVCMELVPKGMLCPRCGLADKVKAGPSENKSAHETSKSIDDLYRKSLRE